MNTVAVLIVSVAPVVGFLTWLRRMDRREPEPFGQVLRVVGLGTLSGCIALVVELALCGLPFFGGQGLRTAFPISFLQIAPVEEACKLAVVLYGVSFLRRGRALSLARWSATPPDSAGPPPAAPIPATPHTAPKAPRWMAVVARILFGLCALLWMLLIIGMFAMKEEGGPGDILLAARC